MTTLKLSFNNEVRRISTTGDITYDQLLDNARSLFPSLHEASTIQLSWKDDEDDQVFVSSDLELLEALRMMKSGTKGYLRFDIQAKVDVPKDQATRGAPVPGRHVGVSCSQCSQDPITGIRYKCSVRDDFNICGACEAKTVQPFPMIKFYVPHPDSTASDIVVSFNPNRRGCRREDVPQSRCGGAGRGNHSDHKKHRGVTCDECGIAGIRGVRFKCTGRQDFDLCASCENRKPIQPFPMVKVYSPDQCPGGLSVYTTSAAPREATIECDIQLPQGLEFLRQIFPPEAHIRGPWGSATWREMAREEGKRAAEAPTSQGGAPARHRHVRCNECGMKPIVGDRYTCTVRPDFDLCSTCEAKQPQPYVMSKIYFPDQQNGLSDQQHPGHGHCGGRGGGRGGAWHGRCGGGRGGGWLRAGRAAAAAEAAERARQHHMGVEVEKAVHREKEMQELEEDLLDITIRESMNSSMSGSSSSSTAGSATSFEESKGQEDGDASITFTLPTADATLVAPQFVPVVAPVEPSAPVKPAVPSRPMARFVRDVTMPDGSKVQPCSVFVKCWRVRNDGATDWPQNCTLVNAGGDEMFPEGATELRVPVPSASAGEEVDISVHLTAPSATGRHVGYFRLQDNEATWFGQRLWADIRVSEDDVPWQLIDSSLTMSINEDEDEEVQRERRDREEENDTLLALAMAQEEEGQETSIPTAPTEQMIWARELDLLEAMGFTDSEVVIPLLKELVREPASAGQHPNSEGLQSVVLTLLSNP